MPQVWERMRLNDADESVVVVPSVTLDRASSGAGTLNQANEERFLFLLLLLRQPRLRMIYVTSMPVSPTSSSTTWRCCRASSPATRGRGSSWCRSDDASPRSLSEKLLDRPRLLHRIAGLVPDRARSHLVPYNTTELERDLALALGIPMYGADPRLRRSDEDRVPAAVRGGRCPAPARARGPAHASTRWSTAVIDDARERPTMTSVIVKLNEGVSGDGNALVDLRGLPPARRRRSSCAASSSGFARCSSSPPTRRSRSTWTSSREAAASSRSGSPARRSAARACSCASPRPGPSSCSRPTTSCSAVRAGRAISAAPFPADAGYARAISDRRGGHRRAAGARWAPSVGSPSTSWWCADRDGCWTPYAIELNLRKGGTTHPFLTLQFLTDGRYERDTGCS